MKTKTVESRNATLRGHKCLSNFTGFFWFTHVKSINENRIEELYKFQCLIKLFVRME